MVIKELQNLIKAGEIERLVLNKQDLDTHIWLVNVVGFQGRSVIENFGNTLKNTSRDGNTRTYTSLDRAYQAMRNLGYTGVLEIRDGE